MSKLDDIQMFYKVKAGKSLYLMPPRPEDKRVLEQDEEELESRIEKGKRGPVPWNDPYAMATAWVKRHVSECEGTDGDPQGPPWGQGPWSRNGNCAKERDKQAKIIASRIGAKTSSGKGRETSGAKTRTAPTQLRGRRRRSSVPLAAMIKAVDDLSLEDQIIKSIRKMGEDCGCTEKIDIEKVSDSLATLMSAAAGWALSGDVTRGRDDHLKQEWEQHHEDRRERERREEERRERRRRRMKKSHDFLVFSNFLTKDHSMVPPRQGLLWDAVKHRWTRPENVGRTVTEVQGSKRFRGVGTGSHERAVGGHGSGAVRRQQAGRRFKGVTDVGRTRPHETIHPSRRGVKGGKAIRQDGHSKAYLKILREHRNKEKRRRENASKKSKSK
jgi:hypothetical protein